jgi:hypothetical protein
MLCSASLQGATAAIVPSMLRHSVRRLARYVSGLTKVERTMLDTTMVIFGGALFALFLGYVAVCDML